MTIKIEFPADRKDIAMAVSRALAEIGGGGKAIPAAEYESAADVCLPRITGAAVVVADLDADAGDDLEAPTTASRPLVDTKGVAYDAKFCANATKPFYASGKTKGQWKKRGGDSAPTEAEYDAWYAGELLKAPTATQTTVTEEKQVDVAATWQAAAQQQPAANTKPVPSNVGQLFQWVSEMQSAGHIAQADVDAAYAQTGINAGMLWGASPADQANMVAALYNTLNAKVSA